MDTQDLINNRDKIQFHFALAFGKIITHETKIISVAASSTLDTSFAHSYPAKPSFVGWVTITGDGRRFPMQTLDMPIYDELGYDIEVYPYATNSTYGFYIDNVATTQKTLTLDYWLYSL